MTGNLKQCLFLFWFLGSVAPHGFASSENSYPVQIRDAKRALVLEYGSFHELSLYEVKRYPMSPITMRRPQEEALLTILSVMNERHIDLCEARILEIGHGSPALLATIQQIRKSRCDELKEIVGVDPLTHPDWTEPFKKELKVRLISSDLEEFVGEHLFDVVIAVDVFKKENECTWGPYKHSAKNAKTLNDLTSESAVVIVINDFNVPSVLSDDLQGTFKTEVFKRYVGDETYRRDARETFNLGALFGELRVSVHTRAKKAD